MSRRSVIWRKKLGHREEEPGRSVKHHRKGSQCGGDLGKLEQCMPSRVVKSDGKTSFKHYTYDPQTGEITGVTLHRGRESRGVVGTRPMSEGKRQRVLSKLGKKGWQA